MRNPKQQLSEFQEKLEKRVLELGQKLQIVEFFEECKKEQKGSLKLNTLNEFRHFLVPVWTSLKADILINLNIMFAMKANMQNVA